MVFVWWKTGQLGLYAAAQALARCKEGKQMYGAWIGDIVGSKYEFHNIKTKDFPLFSPECEFTDDSVMTAAVADAILCSQKERSDKGEAGGSFRAILVRSMQEYGRKYPHPKGEYGGRFGQWLRATDPRPYNSFGNGSAMRVSPCGLMAVELSEAQALARASASVTHNHPEGIKGAEAVASAIYLAKTGSGREEIRQYIQQHYYDLNRTLDEIRPGYGFDESCQGTVPQAIGAFLESESFEDAIRNAISLGGDSDTIGAITGSIAWIYYAVQYRSYSSWIYEEKMDPAMRGLRQQACTYLPEELVRLEAEFRESCWRRAGTYGRVGYCSQILTEAEWQQFQPEEKQPEAAPQKSPEPEKTQEHQPAKKSFLQNIHSFFRNTK